MMYFQDEDVFNERMRVNNESSSEIQSEAVVLKDLTKVCWTVKFVFIKQSTDGCLESCSCPAF